MECKGIEEQVKPGDLQGGAYSDQVTKEQVRGGVAVGNTAFMTRHVACAMLWKTVH